MFTALSQDGSMVAVITSNSGSGRLSVPCFQVSTSQLQLTLTCSRDDDHEPVRRMAFVGNQHLAVLLKRKLVVWDISRGVVSHTVDVSGDEKEALDMATTTQYLYVLIHANGKIYVNQYDADSGKCVRKVKCGSMSDDATTGTSCMMAVYKDEVVAVSHNDGKKHFVKLKSLQDGSKLGKCKLKKPASAITSLVFSDNGTLLAVSTGTSVQVFNVSETTQLTTLHIAEAPTRVSLWNTVSDDYRLLVETSPNTKDFLYELKLSSDKTSLKNSSSPPTTFSCQQGGVVCSLVVNASVVSAVLLHEHRGETRIQQVDYVAQDGTLISDVVLEMKQDEEVAEEPATTNKKRKSSRTTSVLGPGQAGGEALDTVDSQPVMKRHKSDSDDDESQQEEGSSDEEVYEQEEEDDEANDESIAQRLQRLTEAMLQEDEEDELASSSPSTDFVGRKATTESLSHLLRQALQSGDESMLELALTCRDSSILKKTFRELNNELVGSLFTKLTTRIASKPTRADSLALWLRLLLSSGKLTKDSQLSPLRNLLQERVESFPHLLRLEGRLSLLGNVP